MKDGATVHSEAFFVFLSWVSNCKVFVLNLSNSRKKITKLTANIHTFCHGHKKNKTLLASSKIVILLQSFCDFLLKKLKTDKMYTETICYCHYIINNIKGEKKAKITKQHY